MALPRCGRLRLLTLLAPLATALLVWTACDSRAPARIDGGAGSSSGRPLVVCTTTMIADLARQIGGDRIQVLGIMPPQTDPHIYEPRPDDSVLMRKAKLVLYNGLHLEGKMVQILENAGTTSVALAEDPRIHARGSEQNQGAPDPHCWWDARHFMIYAERARDALVAMDPPGAESYRMRTDIYLAELRELDRRIRAAVDKIPPERRYLITSHDAFYYYGAAYGLQVDAVLGISTDASARALRIDELARLVTARRVPAIFHETSVSAALNDMVTRVTELAAKHGHTVVVPAEALCSDSLGEPGAPNGTYLGALRENTRIIVSALSGEDVRALLQPTETPDGTH